MALNNPLTVYFPKDKLYFLMGIKAISAFYKSRDKSHPKASSSSVIVSMIEDYVKKESADIKKKYGIDPVKKYNEFLISQRGIEDFFADSSDITHDDINEYFDKYMKE